MTLVRLDMKPIRDEKTFHEAFARTLGFPDYYGRNLDAWIDCMTSLDDPSAGMTTVHAPQGGVLVLQLDDVDAFARRCPKLFQTLQECAAFVNWRRIERGEPAVLALSYCREA
jgi:Barstar, RNAse (barnase) inhibitor